MRYLWLLAQTKVATILGIFFPLVVIGATVIQNHRRGCRRIGWGRSGDPNHFLQLSFSLVEIILDVNFQPSRMLETQIIYFNPFEG